MCLAELRGTEDTDGQTGIGGNDGKKTVLALRRDQLAYGADMVRVMRRSVRPIDGERTKRQKLLHNTVRDDRLRLTEHVPLFLSVLRPAFLSTRSVRGTR